MAAEGEGRAALIRIRGRVQGVGFRPYVWRLARAHGLRGSVRNDAEGVLVRAEGPGLEAFLADLPCHAPPLARIESVERRPASAGPAPAGFEIVETAGGAPRTRVAPDARLCAACAAEIRDPAARRHRHPFANCTDCGPRFSILEALPYDRATTTMRGFALCAACRAEYADPADRRFHAQPIACPDCGPRAWLERAGAEVPGEAVALAAAALRAGEIVAIRGLGGFHLACDATCEAAVRRLRARKRRPAKPFALMAGDLATVARHARLDAAAAEALASPAGPILLLPAEGAPLAPSVAPGQWALGWMLPTTPLHALLLEAAGGPLVMTSGNRSGEPQATGLAEARARLGPVADAFLMHDRGIARRLDDSLGRIEGGRLRLLRRGRGHAPATLPLPEALAGAPPALAYGGQLKSALCLAREGAALLTHHLGDLDEARTAEEFAAADRDYAALFDHAPEILAVDLHPDYHATAAGAARARAEGLPLHRIQHHHAHIAAAMAEALWPPEAGPVIGVALDGLGLGPDGTIWGGEWLLADYRGFERLAWLAPVPLLGGAAASREPWRNLLAQLDAAGQGAAAERLLAGKPVAALRRAAAAGLAGPRTSSAGRLFDAVAAAIGLAPERQSHEGEAAMRLETAARRGLAAARPYPFAEAGPALDPGPMWAALLADLDRGAPPERIAAAFHLGLAAAVSDRARRLARATGARAVALSGGCFQNATLLGLCRARLAGVELLVPAEAPVNDGGLALGQAAVASARALGLGDLPETGSHASALS